jgi:GcrA cell cycle regulator
MLGNLGYFEGKSSMTSFPWPSSRIERLKQLFAAGHSPGVIAFKLGDGLTRNAVIGKLNRLALMGKNAPARPARLPQRRIRPELSNARITLNTPRKPQIPNETACTEATDLPPEPVANPVTLMQLTEHTCRWPVAGDGATMLYCGAEPAADAPYCLGHCRMAYAGHVTMGRAAVELKLRAQRRGLAA